MPAVVDASVDSNGTFVRGDANGDGDAVISANVHYGAFSVDLSISGTATKPFVLALIRILVRLLGRGFREGVMLRRPGSKSGRECSGERSSSSTHQIHHTE